MANDDLAHTSDPAAAGPEASVDQAPLAKQRFGALARFRSGIRRYWRFSENTARSHGLTPQHYQLLLALKGFPEREWRRCANWPTVCNCATTPWSNSSIEPRARS